jgi:hypothetical protein
MTYDMKLERHAAGEQRSAASNTRRIRTAQHIIQFPQVNGATTATARLRSKTIA